MTQNPANEAAPRSLEEQVKSLKEQLDAVRGEKEFIQNWLADLLEGITAQLDEPAQAKLIGACGQGCYRRHQFKQDMAADAQGSLEKLIDVYKERFEIWRASDGIHIRYGERSPGCYCPAARYRPGSKNDIHCQCTRATHQTIFETALGRPFKVTILRSVRRGDQTCEFLVNEAE